MGFFGQSLSCKLKGLFPLWLHVVLRLNAFNARCSALKRAKTLFCKKNMNELI